MDEERLERLADVVIYEGAMMLNSRILRRNRIQS